MEVHFDDRREAGRKLGEVVRERLEADGVTGGESGEIAVVGLVRGGMPVAREVARALEAPLDVVVVRKLGVPGQPELAFGAIAPAGTRVLNEDIIEMRGLSRMAIRQVEERRRRELKEKERRYRRGREGTSLKGKHVVVVDDGLATGASMRAALRYVEHQSPASVTVAVPVGAEETCEELSRQVDRVVCLRRPRPFFGVAQVYLDFGEVSDERVERILAEYGG